MEHNRLFRTLRAMAWQRAKGELLSMKQTFWDDEPKFDRLYDLIEEFIKTVEEEGLDS